MREELEGVFATINDNVEIQKKRGIRRKIIIAVVIFLALIYVYSLVFGNYSWSVVESLKKEKDEINERTNQLRGKNVALQKMIFELKGLEPQSEEQK